MAKLVYSMIVSLDGYVEDRAGAFDFAAPDDEVHRAANDHARSAAFLFGRRMYEVMEGPWTEAATRDDLPDVEAEFAQIYMTTPRIVFSDTLGDTPQGVRVIRSHDARSEVVSLKQQNPGELALGGPTLAASMVDLIDEFRLFVMPVVVGGGKPFLATPEKLQLRLVNQRAFSSGVVHLRYEQAV